MAKNNAYPRLWQQLSHLAVVNATPAGLTFFLWLGAPDSREFALVNLTLICLLWMWVVTFAIAAEKEIVARTRFSDRYKWGRRAFRLLGWIAAIQIYVHLADHHHLLATMVKAELAEESP